MWGCGLDLGKGERSEQGQSIQISPLASCSPLAHQPSSSSFELSPAPPRPPVAPT